jgi:hypothetical protein
LRTFKVTSRYNFDIAAGRNHRRDASFPDTALLKIETISFCGLLKAVLANRAHTAVTLDPLAHSPTPLPSSQLKE